MMTRTEGIAILLLLLMAYGFVALALFRMDLFAWIVVTNWTLATIVGVAVRIHRWRARGSIRRARRNDFPRARIWR